VVIGPQIAEAILIDLSALAGSARRQSQGVYCWVP
jgi:hypothetical protein